MMKVIIAGSRDIGSLKTILGYISEAVKGFRATTGKNIDQVVSGGCRGVDRMGELWASQNRISSIRFEADWGTGKSGGPIRNRKMAIYADALIAIWDGESRGTKNMIVEMGKLGKIVFVHRI